MHLVGIGLRLISQPLFLLESIKLLLKFVYSLEGEKAEYTQDVVSFFFCSVLWFRLIASG